MPVYRLSQAAARDFEQIFEYGLDNFGTAQAIKYQMAMAARFREIAENPLLYQSVNDIRAGYRRAVCGQHAIYYRQVQDGVEIIRILGAQDIETHLR